MRRKMGMLLTLLLSSAIAASAKAESLVAVHNFYGPGAEALRDRVAALITNQEGVTVISESEVDRLANVSQSDPFSPEGRKEISRRGQLSAWVTGSLEVYRRKVELTVIVYDGAEHALMGRVVMKARNVAELKVQIKRRLWNELRSPLFASLAPLPPGRGPIEGVRTASTHAAYMQPADGLVVSRFGGEQKNDAEADGKKRRQLADPLRFSLGLGSPRRNLRYSDPLSSGLNDYQLGGSVLLDASLQYYPGKHFSQGWPSYFGVDLAAQGAIGASSTDAFHHRYKSHYDAYRVGLRGRLPLGQHFVSAFSGYAITRGSVSTEQSPTAVQTPGVDYRALRSGLGAEFRLVDGVSVGVDAAWLTMLSVGQLGNWFPRATASGFELLFQATYALSEHFFARASGSYRRAVFDFHSRPGDARVAGGATDDVLTFSAGAGMSL